MFDPLWLHKTPIHWLVFSFGVGLEGAAGFLLLSNTARFFLNSKIVRISTTGTKDFSLHLIALCNFIFVCFLIVHSTAFFLGRQCNCFGTTYVPPWASFLFSIFGLFYFSLLLLKTLRNSVNFQILGFKWTVLDARFFSRVVVFATSFVLCVFFLRVDLGRSLLGLDRHPILTVEQHLATGSNDYHVYELQVKNISVQPIFLVSSVSSCSCTTTSQLPLQINGGGTVNVYVRVKNTGGKLSSDEQIAFFTNNPDQLTLKVKVAGRFQFSRT